jgi:hypothetical protein
MKELAPQEGLEPTALRLTADSVLSCTAAESDELAFALNQRHDFSHEDPLQESIAVSDTSRGTLSLDDTRPDRKPTFRYSLADSRLAAGGAAAAVEARSQEGHGENREVVPALLSAPVYIGLAIPHARGINCVDQSNGRKLDADGNDIPSATRWR